MTELRVVPIAIFLLVAALVGIGLLVQGSISEVTGADYGQAGWVVVALGAAVVVYLVPYSWVVRRAWLGYGLCLLLLLLVPVLGVVRNNSQRWLLIGGFSLQPSELMKVAYIVAMARVLRYRRDFSKLRHLVGPGLLLFVPVLLILEQPDLGTALLFIPTALGMLFVAGVERRPILIVLCGGAVVAVLAYLLVLEPYQKERILSTVMRDRLTAAERKREGWQLEQSIRSVAIGGMTGQGLGRGLQNRMNRLPFRENDFIFAVIAEELGFLGAIFLFALILALLFLMFRVAYLTKEPGGRLLCVGLGTLYGTQSLVHIGVNLGVVPTTGMTLPFVSAGGTSLVTFTVVSAVVANVARRPLRVLRGGHSVREQLARLDKLLRARGARSTGPPAA